jgi:hypothetical protein
MMDQLLKPYNLEYPKGHKEQLETLKEFVNRASEKSSHKNPKLMYSLLLEFSKEAKLSNLKRHMCTLLKIKDDKESKCLMCGKETTKMCSRCEVGKDPAVYCKRECQKAHWPVHKLVCKQKIKPLSTEEISYIVGVLIDKRWNTTDTSYVGKDCPIPITEVADACARLFNCVCLYLFKEDKITLVLPMEPPHITFPKEHEDFLSSISKNLSPKLSVEKEMVLSAHIEKYLQNFNDWKAGSTRFGFVGRPEVEDIQLL